MSQNAEKQHYDFTRTQASQLAAEEDVVIEDEFCGKHCHCEAVTHSRRFGTERSRLESTKCYTIPDNSIMTISRSINIGFSVLRDCVEVNSPKMVLCPHPASDSLTD